MKIEHLELLKRLKACTLDDAAAALPFSERLARDHHWPLAFAQRVIHEYKRFAFLAVAAGHPVSPSYAVDEAWHLHLLYTQSYWKDFCGEVLRTPLHHQPTRGGAAERGKFENWYANTLASYREYFGEEPPSDIWPERNEHPIQVHFNPEMHWLMPKPRALARKLRNRVGRLVRFRPGPIQYHQECPRPLTMAALRGSREFLRICLVRPAATLWLMMLVLFVAGCGSEMTALVSPFDFKGPEFLGFYFACLVAVCVAAAFLRWYWRQPADAAGETIPQLDPYAVTYLAGGRGLAVSAALTNLCQRGAISVSSLFGRVAAVKPLPADAHPLERSIHDLVALTSGTVKSVREQATELTTPIAESLKEQGLVVPDAQARKAMLVPLLLAAMVPVMGFIKILVGLERHRPVGFLVTACLASLIGVAVGFARRPLRSRRGDSVLAALRHQHEGLRETVRTSLTDASSVALPLAVGLFGMSVLAGTPLDDLRTKLQPTMSGSTCGSSCGGSSCGGGGGCGGGCGGCGGGGD